METNITEWPVSPNSIQTRGKVCITTHTKPGWTYKWRKEPWTLISSVPALNTNKVRCTEHTHTHMQTHILLHKQNRAERPCQTNYWNINGPDVGEIGPIWIGNGWMILIGINTQKRSPPSHTHLTPNSFY